MESIVKQHHQKAAYCGILWFDSDAFPEEYRGKLFMGNIHGSCINVDEIKPDGSTYVGTARPDFLTANDPWFMPVSQKVGPDGCLYVLDWYDRYHCYQDARRDPDGIDRDRGRIYRIRYKNSPRAPKFDLGKESDDQLVERLRSPNIYFRETAQRLLAERATPDVKAKLEKVVLDEDELRKTRMQALWRGSVAARWNRTSSKSCSTIRTPASAPGPCARRQRRQGGRRRAHEDRRAGRGPVAAGAVADGHRRPQDRRHRRHSDSASSACRAAATTGSFRTSSGRTCTRCWRTTPASSCRSWRRRTSAKSPHLAALMPRVTERILGRKQADPALIARLFGVLFDAKGLDGGVTRQCLDALAKNCRPARSRAAGRGAARQVRE